MTNYAAAVAIMALAGAWVCLLGARKSARRRIRHLQAFGLLYVCGIYTLVALGYGMHFQFVRSGTATMLGLLYLIPIAVWDALIDWKQL